MPDEHHQYLEAFEACRLGPGEFSHRDHVRVAWLMLEDASLEDTLAGISGRATLQLEGGSGGIPESLVEEVRSTPGVEAAAPMILERVESPEAGPGGTVAVPPARRCLPAHSHPGRARRTQGGTGGAREHPHQPQP